MNKLLIHSATRMIVHLTRDNNIAPLGFEYLTVPDNYVIAGSDKKLDTDNITQLNATLPEITIFRETTNPEIQITRNLRQAALNLYNSTTNNELKAFLVAFRNWVKEII